MNIAEIREKLARYGQSGVLRFYDELDENGKKRLGGQLSEIDFASLDRLIGEYVLKKPEFKLPSDLRPAPFFPLTPRSAAESELYRRAEACGRELLRSGKVSFLTVAGGQGTRLGYDGPKGTYPIAPVSGKSLFCLFAEKILRLGEKFDRKFTWYIMTSIVNHEQTTAFFREHGFFGLDEKQVFFFTQGTMPAIGYDGKLLLGSKDSLSLSPDGHGGTLLALHRSGALERMRREGVEYISYFQVDNPLAPMGDARFLGLHALEKSEMSAITLAKTGPFEKLGNFCLADGKLTIIEYSDLPAELAESRNPDGSLRFVAGSPAIHVISRSFVERLTAGGSLRLPYHRADKKVPFIDDGGASVKPEVPNAVKLETFIFDALALAEKTMVMEAAREDVFAPTKNATGVDSVESCRRMMLAKDAKMLAAAGVDFPFGADGGPLAKAELSPRRMADAEDVAEYVKARNITRVAPGETLYFD